MTIIGLEPRGLWGFVMRNCKWLHWCVVVAAGGTALVAAEAIAACTAGNIVKNPSFEDGSAWAFGGPAKRNSLDPAFSLDGIHQGVLSGFGAADIGHIAQDLITEAGCSYQLTFNWAQNGSARGHVEARLGGASLVLVNLETLPVLPIAPTCWKYAFNFVATGATTTLEFLGIDVFQTVFIDGVSAASPVPEVGGRELLLAGLAATAWLARRRVGQAPWAHQPSA